MNDIDLLVDMAFNDPEWEWIGWGIYTGNKLIKHLTDMLCSAIRYGLVEDSTCDLNEVAKRIESERL